MFLSEIWTLNVYCNVRRQHRAPRRWIRHDIIPFLLTEPHKNAFTIHTMTEYIMYKVHKQTYSIYTDTPKPNRTLTITQTHLHDINNDEIREIWKDSGIHVCMHKRSLPSRQEQLSSPYSDAIVKIYISGVESQCTVFVLLLHLARSILYINTPWRIT